MAIHVSKNKIRATGSEANSFLIALSNNETLLKWEKDKTGSEDFRRIVKEAIAARGLQTENQPLAY